LAWSERLDDLASVAAWRTGRHEQALAHGLRAAALAPTDERIAANVDLFRRTLAEAAAAGPSPR
jgi:hypothetical protein